MISSSLITILLLLIWVIYVCIIKFNLKYTLLTYFYTLHDGLGVIS